MVLCQECVGGLGCERTEGEWRGERQRPGSDPKVRRREVWGGSTGVGESPEV